MPKEGRAVSHVRRLKLATPWCSALPPLSVPRRDALNTWPTNLAEFMYTGRDCFLRRSADFDGSVFLDSDRIARLDGIEKVVAKQVDADYASAIPNIIHQHSGE